MLEKLPSLWNGQKTVLRVLSHCTTLPYESEREGSLRVVLNPEFRLILEAHTERRRYNLPTASEVAVIIPDDIVRNTRDVILFARNSDGTLSERFEFIPRNHPAYLPLHYVLFYPLGNPGYHLVNTTAKPESPR